MCFIVPSSPTSGHRTLKLRGLNHREHAIMTDPHSMRAMAGRFEVHAQTVEDESRKMWASSMNIAGAGWSGQAQATSYDTMSQMNQAFRNVVTMLHGVRDGLVRDANNYEQQEQASQQALSS
jgi:WXG100 family type VII secretion target